VYELADIADIADIADVEVLAAHELQHTFADGTVGEVEFAGRDRRGGVLEPRRDPDYFAQVRVDAELGTIAWPNGADLAAEPLCEGLGGIPSSPRLSAAEDP
jgi:hypothetical protein